MKLLLSFLFLCQLTPLLFAELLEIRDEDVSIKVGQQTLRGSMTRGAESENFQHRAVLLISGSGPTDRDGNSLPLMRNHSLKYLAHAISRNGIATLRVDKRGVAASKDAGLKEEDLRFTTYVDDISQWIDYLNKQGFKEVILVGHSEGALVGTLAAKHLSVIGMVSLAGTGRPAADILKEQLKKNTPEEVSLLADGIIDQLMTGQF